MLICAIWYILFLRKSLKPVKTKGKSVKIEKGDYQVVVVVNKDLNMSKGKVLSQFGHAIDALHEKFEGQEDLVKAWRNSGSAKIALKGTQDDLNKIYNDCKGGNLIYVKICDAGRTQVKSGSNTVIAVGPATKKQLEHITGHLQLY